MAAGVIHLTLHGAISRPSTARAPHARHVLVRVSWSSDQEASKPPVPIQKLVMLH